MVGIKETKELLVGVNEVAIVMIERLKDGLQLGEDVAAIIGKWQSDSDFQAKVTLAVMGINGISAEVKEIDVNEAVELAGVQLSYIPKILEAAKKISAE